MSFDIHLTVTNKETKRDISATFSSELVEDAKGLEIDVLYETYIALKDALEIESKGELFL